MFCQLNYEVDGRLIVVFFLNRNTFFFMSYNVNIVTQKKTKLKLPWN